MWRVRFDRVYYCGRFTHDIRPIWLNSVILVTLGYIQSYSVIPEDAPSLARALQNVCNEDGAEGDHIDVCVSGRARRQRRDVWTFETTNSTCERSGRARLFETQADIVCIQEHKSIINYLVSLPR